MSEFDFMTPWEKEAVIELIKNPEITEDQLTEYYGSRPGGYFPTPSEVRLALSDAKRLASGHCSLWHLAQACKEAANKNQDTAVKHLYSAKIQLENLKKANGEIQAAE